MGGRQAAGAAESGGCPIPAGSPVTVYNGSANRDATRWDDPDRFDIDREPVTPGRVHEKGKMRTVLLDRADRHHDGGAPGSDRRGYLRPRHLFEQNRVVH